MIHGHWCTHFEVSVRTFQGLYANRIKIGTCTQIEKPMHKHGLFYLVDMRGRETCVQAAIEQ